jgi:hypothetical protein
MITGFAPSRTGMVYANVNGMRWSIWIRRVLTIAAIYAVGLAEAYYLPRYGIEIFLGALAATAFLTGLWMRARWYM